MRSEPLDRSRPAKGAGNLSTTYPAEGLEDVGVPVGATPDPGNPGWFSWGDFPRGSFAAATGRLMFKPDGPGRGLTRMMPTEMHMNMGGSIHGGAVMSFIDMSMFAGGLCAGMERGHYVTLDLTTHFLARGKDGIPLEAHVELVRQTRGHAFLQGVVKQDGENCYSFSGTLKRVNRPNGPSRQTK